MYVNVNHLHYVSIVSMEYVRTVIHSLVLLSRYFRLSTNQGRSFLSNKSSDMPT